MYPSSLTRLLSYSLTLLFLVPTAKGAELRDDFKTLAQWVVEQAPGGTVSVRDGALLIQDRDGCTVVFKQRLKAPVHISYKVTVVDKGGPCDRVSDLNCFWMASDPRSPVDLFKPGHKRDGRFASYDSLSTYYVGFGGNSNTTTRFRRYSGDGQRPLLPEHDLKDPDFLLAANHEYLIEVSAAKGWIEFKRDGEILFRWRDPAPLTEGWFGFRTVKSHLTIRDFKVTTE